VKTGGKSKGNEVSTMNGRSFILPLFLKSRLPRLLYKFICARSAYKRAKRGASTARSRRDAKPPDPVPEIVIQHHFRYGSLRVWEAAPGLGETGLKARRKRRFIPATGSNHGLEV
jgi:hypothetical protein